MGPSQHIIHGHSVLSDVKLESKSVAYCDMEAKVDVPPERLFDLLADPRHHNVIFDSVENVESKLLHDDGQGSRQWNVDYDAHWKFWKVGGILKVGVVMDTNKASRTVSFKLREPGFLKVYEGAWSIFDPATAPIGPLSSANSKGSSSGKNSSKDGSKDNSTKGGSRDGSKDNSIKGGSDSGVSSRSNSGSRKGVGALAAISSSGGSASKSKQDDSLAAALNKSMGISGSAELADAGALKGPLESLVRFHTRMGPKVAPPYPLNQLLKGQLLNQSHQMIAGLMIRALAGGAGTSA